MSCSLNLPRCSQSWMEMECRRARSSAERIAKRTDMGLSEVFETAPPPCWTPSTRKTGGLPPPVYTGPRWAGKAVRHEQP